jgi:hypothetical protein
MDRVDAYIVHVVFFFLRYFLGGITIDEDNPPHHKSYNHRPRLGVCRFVGLLFGLENGGFVVSEFHFFE